MSDTKQILLDISYDCIHSLVTDELKDLKSRIEQDLTRRQNGSLVGVFHTDVDLDVKELQEHLAAVDKILSWY